MSAAEPPSRDFVAHDDSWLQSLRFHLGPNRQGKYVFSHVHLTGAPSHQNRERFLQDLLTGRTLEQVLRALTPLPTASGTELLDSQTASELRNYFHHLAQQLHL